MYGNVINKLETEIKTTTIKKRNIKSVKKDLHTAVDSLLDEDKESIAVLPTVEPRTEKIPDLRDVKKIKKKVVIETPTKPIKPLVKKKRNVVWL